MADSTASYLIYLLAAISLGRIFAQWLFPQLNTKQRRHVSFAANAVMLCCVVAMAALIRPNLPKEGIWEIVHTDAELRDYHQALVITETMSNLIEQFEASNDTLHTSWEQLRNKNSTIITTLDGEITVSRNVNGDISLTFSRPDGERTTLSLYDVEEDVERRLTAEYLAGDTQPRDTIL